MNYGNGKTNATKLLVDRIQQDFTCCGIVGPEDWINSNFNNINSSSFERGVRVHIPEQGIYRIPHSCCKVGSRCVTERLVDRIRNTSRLNEIDGLNLDGCIPKFGQFIHDKWQLILLTSCVLVGVQIFALFFACILCCAISRQDDK